MLKPTEPPTSISRRFRATNGTIDPGHSVVQLKKHSYMDTHTIRRAGDLRAQGLSLKVIAMRLGVSEGQASKLAKAAAQHRA